MTPPSAIFVTTVPITLEAFLTPFAQSLRSKGWRVDALANGATENEHIATSFDHCYDVAWSRNPLDPRNLLTSASTVREIVEAGSYDIVHVHTPVAAFVTRWALRALPRATRPIVIYTAHGFHFYGGQRPLPHAVFRTFERLAARWTDYLVTINAEDEMAAKRLGGISPNRVRRIPGIGVDVDRFAPGVVAAADAATARSELSLSDTDFMLTMIAEFSPVKRHDHVLQAISRVRDERIVLVLVGDGPLEAQVRDRVAALGLTKRVRFAGYRRDIAAVLAASDALVLVSEREGLNRSALEAMASSRPVIGTDTRGIADAVDNRSGWIVAKNDVTALAAAIEAAAGDPTECARRGHAARERVLREFALPRIIAEYEELYREALASRV